MARNARCGAAVFPSGKRRRLRDSRGRLHTLQVARATKDAACKSSTSLARQKTPPADRQRRLQAKRCTCKIVQRACKPKMPPAKVSRSDARRQQSLRPFSAGCTRE
jgi:hypothetical protein